MNANDFLNKILKKEGYGSYSLLESVHDKA